MWGRARSQRDLRALRPRAASVRYPLVLWILLAVFLVVAADAIFGGLLGRGLRRTGMNFDAARSLTYLIAMAIVGLAFLVRWRQMRRVRRLLARHGYLLCVKCHYPLSSEDERGRCPECSQWYQTADVITAWQEWESLQSTPVHG